MEGVASEVSLKIRSAIKAKLVELGTYVDEELPDYIMVLVANKKTKDQMDDDLSLFLGHNTERFTSWLHHVLQKLNAAALLQETGKNKGTPQEDVKKKESEEEKRREKEEEKKREHEEEKKRIKATEEAKKQKEEEKKKAKEKEKGERKKKSSERKSEKKEKEKEKKVRKSESPPSPERAVKERKHSTSEATKPTKPKEPVREKEKEKTKTPPQPSPQPSPQKIVEPVTTVKAPITTITSTIIAPPKSEPVPEKASPDATARKIKPLVRGKISSADIFRAESKAGKKDEEEEEPEEDLLVLRADPDDLGLELDDEPAPKKSKSEQPQRAVHVRTEVREDKARTEPRVTLKMEGSEKGRSDHREKSDRRDKEGHRSKSSRSKPDPPAPRLSAKERLGSIVQPKVNTSREKPSVLDRLGGSGSGKQSSSVREESNLGVARAVSSAITSAHRSVCVLPPSNSSGKKLEARVRPLMSRQVESSHSSSGGGGGRAVTEISTSGPEERVREVGAGRLSSGRVVSAVGAVLKRPLAQSDSDDDEEYDPKKPGLSGLASKVEVTPRPRRPRAIQANTALILRAMADAHKSVNRPSSRHTREREKAEKEKSSSRKKHKGELYSRSYRAREEASRQKTHSDSETHFTTPEELTIRKIAITVPNATHSEAEEMKQEKIKVKKVESEEEEEGELPEEEEEEEEDDVIVPVTLTVKEEPMETSKKSLNEEEPVKAQQENKTQQAQDHGFRMEEVEEEEVEMETMHEGIEEDHTPPPPPQPLPQQHHQHTLLPPALASQDNTKFIVTLEGMDNEEFPVKDLSAGIRSRLGAKAPPPAPLPPPPPPVPLDTDDQVEEYIEEVEEWEEEEELPEEMETSSSIVQVPGEGVTGVKARLTAANTTPGITTQLGGTKERCKYWPLCKAGESCVFHHPTVPCKSFPACKFGDKCLFIHPNCIYDAACTRLGCPYTHASTRNFAMVSATATQKHTGVTPSIKCKFFPKCTNLSCPFIHPKACFYGSACKTPNCSFTHPTVPTGDKLKWVAPKISGTQPAAPTTTTPDIKEVEQKQEILVNK